MSQRELFAEKLRITLERPEHDANTPAGLTLTLQGLLAGIQLALHAVQKMPRASLYERSGIKRPPADLGLSLKQRNLLTISALNSTWPYDPGRRLRACDKLYDRLSCRIFTPGSIDSTGLLHP